MIETEEAFTRRSTNTVDAKFHNVTFSCAACAHAAPGTSFRPMKSSTRSSAETNRTSLPASGLLLEWLLTVRGLADDAQANAACHAGDVRGGGAPSTGGDTLTNRRQDAIELWNEENL